MLEKEYSGICGEHYVLKEENGNVTIYKVDENKNETFYKNTDIATEYLADEDKKRWFLIVMLLKFKVQK